MSDSILLSIREALVGDPEDDSFDQDLIFDINTALNTLTQVGVGPNEGFKISGSSEVWSDFLGENPKLEMAKDFVKFKVRVLFDPPTTSFVLDEYNKELDQMLWRLNVEVDDQKGGT
jgi:hypothetical protein